MCFTFKKCLICSKKGKITTVHCQILDLILFSIVQVTHKRQSHEICHSLCHCPQFHIVQFMLFSPAVSLKHTGIPRGLITHFINHCIENGKSFPRLLVQAVIHFIHFRGRNRGRAPSNLSLFSGVSFVEVTMETICSLTDVAFT